MRYKLLYYLPGQRVGARDSCVGARDSGEKLQGVLEIDGFKTFDGAPALFVEPKSLIVIVLIVATHVDGLQTRD